MRKFIIFLIFLSACSTLQSAQQLCEQEGGTWREFADTCAEKCLSERKDTGQQETEVRNISGDPYACAQVITESCDCPPDTCWTGTECITL